MVTINNCINNTIGCLTATDPPQSTLQDFTVSNTSSTAGSQAKTVCTVAGSSGGDCFTSYSANAATILYSHGIDNSDSDKFVISASDTLGTNNIFTITPSGNISQPGQTGFSAYLDVDVTATLTDYVVVFDTIVYNNNSLFDGSQFQNFTFPYGICLINASVTVLVTAGNTSISCTIETDFSIVRTYISFPVLLVDTLYTVSVSGMTSQYTRLTVADSGLGADGTIIGSGKTTYSLIQVL